MNLHDFLERLKRDKLLQLRVAGATLTLIFGLVLLTFYGLSFIMPLLASVAPRPLEAWRFVRVKGIEIADHSVVFEKFNITVYNGSATCIECHEREAREVANSIHYLTGVRSRVQGLGEVWLGSRFVYNDYCGAIFWNATIPVNFIGVARLVKAPPGFVELKGRLIATGCSMCHGVSLGAIPSLYEPSDRDLKNIDCLVCHHLEYKGGAKGVFENWRVVVKTEEGFRYVTAPGRSAVDLAKSIAARPPKEACLWCHAFSGRDPGFKRPNLTPDLIGEVSERFDVHMARGLQCVDCHLFEEHQVDIGDAVDTWSHTGVGDTLLCEECHPAGERHRAPLVGFIVETFHHRVACQTCRIPLIAHGRYPTDVMRDWSHAEFNEALGRWEPVIRLEGNVTPVYAW